MKLPSGSGAASTQTIYIVTYTIRGHEHDTYFREDFSDPASAEAFIGRIQTDTGGYIVTGFFELRVAS